MKLGLIGGGTMGSLHARVISQAEGCSLAWVHDPDQDMSRNLESRYGTTTDVPRDIDAVDALIIASPTDTHAGWCTAAIDAGVPFLVEKPLSVNLDETETVVGAALTAGLPFTVGFVERFNPAVMTLRGIIDAPVFFSAIRHSPFAARIRGGVAADLLIHDIDLAVRLLQQSPSAVTASYLSVHPESTGTQDIAEVQLRFENVDRMASLSASRIAQRKIRMLTLGNPDIAAELDLVRQDITIYRHVLNSPLTEDGLGYRQETVIEIPELVDRREPLAAQLAWFMQLVRGEADAASEAVSVLEPHRVLAAADASAVSGRAEALTPSAH